MATYHFILFTCISMLFQRALVLRKTISNLFGLFFPRFFTIFIFFLSLSRFEWHTQKLKLPRKKFRNEIRKIKSQNICWYLHIITERKEVDYFEEKWFRCLFDSQLKWEAAIKFNICRKNVLFLMFFGFLPLFLIFLTLRLFVCEFIFFLCKMLYLDCFYFQRLNECN